MTDIIRKKMKDVNSPQGDTAHRSKETHSVHVEVVPERRSDHLDKNPFFEKRKHADRIADHTQGAHKAPRAKHRASKLFLWVVIIVPLLSAGFLLANYFTTATIEITPIVRSAHIDKDFTAPKDSVNNEDFVFRFMSLTEEKTMEVPALVEKKIQKKASGKVVIFNAYNGEKQRLIKNTRLETPDHKIFRIDESVVVPGATVVKGKVTVPGSVEALIYADVPGKEYNIGTTNFTIPGFKGDPRYTKFTAASKPDSPIGGGFSGTVKVPSDESVLAAEEELKQSIKKTAVEKARAQIPEGSAFFPGSIVIKFASVPQEFSTNAMSKITMRATVSVFFFDEKILSKKIAEILPAGDRGKMFTISNLSALNFTFTDPVDNIVLSDISKISFHISGDPVFVGNIDTEKILQKFAGKNKKDFSEMIAGEGNIDSADAVIRPMWNKIFPVDPAKIKVEIIEQR